MQAEFTGLSAAEAGTLPILRGGLQLSEALWRCPGVNCYGNIIRPNRIATGNTRACSAAPDFLACQEKPSERQMSGVGRGARRIVLVPDAMPTDAFKRAVEKERPGGVDSKGLPLESIATSAQTRHRPPLSP